MKLAAYLRVSTDAQTDGLGLEVQADTIDQWARAHGHRVVRTFTDAGVSGSNGLESRTALADALAALHAHEADGLVVYRLDRLARDLIVQEQLLAECRRSAVPVFSTSAGEDAYLVDDPADPSRRLIRQVLGAVAEYERAMIALRLRAGRERKHAGGGYAYGAPPFGWRAVDGQLVEVETEQAALALIAALRGEGKSWRAIAAELTERRHRPRRGERWHADVVRRIATRPAPNPAAGLASNA